MLDFGIDYFKYDNCYPRLDGKTKCFLPHFNKIKRINVNSTGCDDGCNQYVNGLESLAHFPSFWQEPSEEVRLVQFLSDFQPMLFKSIAILK